jgi:hypothetical protein
VTRPVWKPHIVRDQRAQDRQDRRTLAYLRSLPPQPQLGPGSSSPTNAELVFNFPTWAGNLTTGMSDFKVVRWQCAVIGAWFNVTTFGGAFTIVVYKNGTAIPGLTCNVGGDGQEFLCSALLCIPGDKISVNATTPGSGNQGIVVNVRLA